MSGVFPDNRVKIKYVNKSFLRIFFYSGTFRIVRQRSATFGDVLEDGNGIVNQYCKC